MPVTPARPYALWDVESGNQVGAYETKAAALAVVLEAARRNGAADVDLLGLVYNDEQDEIHKIAEGAELLQLVKRIVEGHVLA